MAAAFALALSVAAGPAFAACDSDNAIFEDDFEFMDISWGAPSDAVFVEDGQLIINGFMGQVNFLTQSKGANVCADLTILEATDIPNSPTGLVFWWQDWNNYYVVFTWADGWVEVRRYKDGNLTTVFTEQTMALKKGVAIGAHPGIDATRLSEIIYFDRSTIGDVLDRMEGKGWILRQSTPDDRRIKRVDLSPAGHAVLQQVEPGIRRVQERLLAGLTSAEAKTLVRLLAKMADGDEEGCIGGVLEPPNAAPVMVGDECLIGSRCVVADGARVGDGVVLGAGCILTGSIPVIESWSGDEVGRGVVPPWTVAVAATRPRAFAGGHEFGLPCVLLVRKLDEGQRHDKSALNQVLRDHGATL
jgi:DNA-binding MarR family transcriptional regulator